MSVYMLPVQWWKQSLVYSAGLVTLKSNALQLLVTFTKK